MKKAKYIFLVLVTLSILIAGILYVVSNFAPKTAGLYISTNPESTVFIDSEEVGRTPYRENMEAKEIVVRLVPDSFDRPLVPFESKIVLTEGVETAIYRDFGEFEENSGGEILSFEREAKDKTSLAIISSPDSALIEIDGTKRGFAPYVASDIFPGKHQLLISAEGFQQRTLELNLNKGYKLTVVVKLARFEDGEVTNDDPEQTEEKLIEKRVNILSTPTNFLRVRSEPSTLGSEVARVAPGDQFALLEENDDSGWFKIKYLSKGEGVEDSVGWISSTYAEVVEVEVEKQNKTNIVSSKKQ